jgi:hypothetical protein
MLMCDPAESVPTEEIFKFKAWLKLNVRFSCLVTYGRKIGLDGMFAVCCRRFLGVRTLVVNRHETR